MNCVHSLDPVQQAQREYLESRVLSAQPAEMVEMLYQIAIQSLKKAIGHLKSGDAMARAGEVTRAQEAVNELMAALDHSVGASFTQTLAALYAYVQQQILKGHAGPSEEALQRAIGILTTLAGRLERRLRGAGQGESTRSRLRRATSNPTSRSSASGRLWRSFGGVLPGSGSGHLARLERISRSYRRCSLFAVRAACFSRPAAIMFAEPQSAFCGHGAREIFVGEIHGGSRGRVRIAAERIPRPSLRARP